MKHVFYILFQVSLCLLCCNMTFKGLVHPEMNALSSFTPRHVSFSVSGAQKQENQIHHISNHHSFCGGNYTLNHFRTKLKLS